MDCHKLVEECKRIYTGTNKYALHFSLKYALHFFFQDFETSAIASKEREKKQKTQNIVFFPAFTRKLTNSLCLQLNTLDRPLSKKGVI